MARPLAASSRCRIASVIIALTIAALTHDLAYAQGRFEAIYSISVARITVGNASVTAEMGDREYSASMSGRGSAVMRILANGDGNLQAQGLIKDGRLVPIRYISATKADDDTLDVKMTFENGNTKDVVASPPPPGDDRVALTDEHRTGVTDPLTALFIPTGDAGPGQAVCERVLPIFDGRRRYDLKLAFKRMDQGKADQGYAGPIVVCSLTLQPIAGHRKSSALMSFLTEGREMEVAFAPITGTPLVAPFRLTVFHILGNLVMQATRFATSSPAPVTSADSPR